MAGRIDAGHAIKQIFALFAGPVKLRPFQWQRSARAIVMMIALLKVLEIMVFSNSSLLCFHSPSVTLSSQDDYLSLWCETQLKRLAAIPLGVTDSLIILICTAGYMGVLVVVGNQLQSMQTILESFPYEETSSASARIPKEFSSDLKANVKWQQAKKTALYSLIALAISIAGAGTVLYLFLNTRVEYLHPLECELEKFRFKEQLERKAITCIWNSSSLLEFLHSSNFYLSVGAAVLFLVLLGSVSAFLTQVEVRGSFDYERDKFDMDEVEGKKKNEKQGMLEEMTQQVDMVMGAGRGTGGRR